MVNSALSRREPRPGGENRRFVCRFRCPGAGNCRQSGLRASSGRSRRIRCHIKTEIPAKRSLFCDTPPTQVDLRCLQNRSMPHGCGFSPVRSAGAGTWRPGCHLLPGCPGPGPAQAGRDRSDVKVQRLSPVHRHIATVTGAAARPGTGQRAGLPRLVRGMRHREPLAWPRGHQAALTPKKPHPCHIVPVAAVVALWKKGWCPGFQAHQNRARTGT